MYDVILKDTLFAVDSFRYFLYTLLLQNLVFFIFFASSFLALKSYENPFAEAHWRAIAERVKGEGACKLGGTERAFVSRVAACLSVKEK